MRRRSVLFLVLLSSLFTMGNQAPWAARRRPLPRPNRIAEARIAIADWPTEPTSPANVDHARFETALRTICGMMPRERSHRYSEWILGYAHDFDVDPFLLAALVFREGRCRSDAEGGDGGERESGIGLTLIHSTMYWENVRHGTLRYQVLDGTNWVTRERPLDRFPFNGPRLAQPEENLYFAAALLRLWRDQHASIDQGFEQAPHRHYVSHFVWGDRVRSGREEDAILTERRRLLEYYGATNPEPEPIAWGGLRLGCPLDGCPRVISSWIGSERDEGARHHRGIDVESLPGEPIRAIADGLVVFAGVDLPGGQAHEQLVAAADYERYSSDDLGAGGRYVCIRHTRPGLESVRSCYMHMEEVHVRYGATVRRGHQLGTVGRTGMQRSAAHLHLEISTDQLEDPSEILNGLLLGRRDNDPYSAH